MERQTTEDSKILNQSRVDYLGFFFAKIEKCHALKAIKDREGINK